MRARQILKLVEGTADPAFAVDAMGLISAWNRAAADLFGRSSVQAIGRPCHEIMQGSDERGLVCSEGCAIQQAVQENRPPVNFDFHVVTASGRQWCNASVMVVTDSESGMRHALHIVRVHEQHKRLEQLARDFVASHTELEHAPSSSGQRIRNSATLTARETEILRILATGSSSQSIARQLHISQATVTNHIKHILAKLNVHSRLEAIRHAERLRLI